jgi:hypothetical protein
VSAVWVAFAVVTTDLIAGKIRRAPGKRSLLYKLATYKKAYVWLADTPIKAAPPLQ